MRRVHQDCVDAFERIYQTIKTYPISVVEVRDKDLPSVCRIFQRINQAGKRLDRFDLVSTMTFTKDFDLRERLKEDIQSPLATRGCGHISPAIVTQLMALLKHGACTERHEYNLRADDITAMWPRVKDSVLLAADTRRKGMGVMTAAYMPYDALITLLAYIYAQSGQRSLSSDQMRWVERWFWRASFGEYYGSGGPTKMGRDRDLLDQLLEGKDPTFEPPLNSSNSCASTRSRTMYSCGHSGIVFANVHSSVSTRSRRCGGSLAASPTVASVIPAGYR
jgi:hypothetical protein